MSAQNQPITFFELPNAEGRMLRGSLHLVASATAPLVIFCHGFTGSRFGPGYLFIKIARALAAMGISSLRFDFMGSGESDGLFSAMHTGTMQRDLKAITQYARTLLQPHHLILLGHSYGGMIAALCAAQVAANGIILLAPVGDPEGLIRRRKALLDAGPNNRGYFENGPHEMSIEFLDHLQGFDPAAALAADFFGNLLLVQGDCDQSITVAESFRYIEQAKNCPITTTYHLINGADHNFSRVTDVTMLTTTIPLWTKEHFL